MILLKDEMFYAEKNNGAFFNNRRIRVSKKNDIKQLLICFKWIIWMKN